VFGVGEDFFFLLLKFKFSAIRSEKLWNPKYDDETN
jgi:hypothetical protein